MDTSGVVLSPTGRQYSQVRSLNRGMWDTPQLELVKLLHNDPVLPTKEAFIKAKYVDHAFIRKPSKDDEPWSLDDVNKQLWSCVRTAHVDTTLRLLAMGADVHYVDPEKGNSPLHVAAKEGQAMQVELLYIYGADPLLCNAADLTPAQLARQDGFHQQHFLIPELTAKNTVETLRSVRLKIQALPDCAFEKLLQDVYDEVDRRETQAAWMAMNQGKITSGNEQCVAVFLPVELLYIYGADPLLCNAADLTPAQLARQDGFLNPAFSATRNQLRQKLAKYDVREFATLIIDVLKEAKRRYFGRPPEDLQETLDTSNVHNLSSNTRMDSGELNRDYDEVADFPGRLGEVRSSGTTRRSSGNKTRSTSSIDAVIDGRVSIDDVLELKERMTENENKLNSISHTNTQIMKQIVRLSEQAALARRLPSPATVPHMPSNHIVERAHSVGLERGDRIGRPPIEESRIAKRHGSMSGSTPGYSRMIPSGRMSAENHRERDESRESREKLRSRERILDSNDYATITPAPQVVASKVQEAFSEPVFPDNLIRETENLTVAIRALLTDAQHKQLHGRSSDHAHKILSAKCNAPVLDAEDACHAAYSVAQSAKMLLMAVHH
ncbi:hypothetical protein ANCCEY_00277 [Ancylostoma ceylanicum]|uniref:GIT Spa2 homology (SHD) domain-containing protein n=1 Tax=Ancylostoma ceylanicum TaxID=53326 RepID=A0A0D6MAC6_9BILA|nr:hypothetical protein ANCCEY_00277 [Ancylostoma ceylanicum]